PDPPHPSFVRFIRHLVGFCLSLSVFPVALIKELRSFVLSCWLVELVTTPYGALKSMQMVVCEKHKDNKNKKLKI
ncbi:hypothetical protein AB4494_22145, partial [Vibrio sp. 10N.222.46.B3]